MDIGHGVGGAATYDTVYHKRGATLSPHEIDAQGLDAAWNHYIEADTDRLIAFQALVQALVPDQARLAAIMDAYRSVVTAERLAAQAIRDAQADIYARLTLRLNEAEELAAGLQVEAGLSRRVEDLEAQVQVAQADILAIASRTAEFEARL